MEQNKELSTGKQCDIHVVNCSAIAAAASVINDLSTFIHGMTLGKNKELSKMELLNAKNNFDRLFKHYS